MKSHDLTSLLRKTLGLTFGISLLASAPLRADLNSDLAFTAFSNVDVNALAGGQVLQSRGGLIDFMRGVTAQSLFILDAAPADVQNKLVTWNPASHPELKVWLHKSLPAKPTAADFSGLSTLPDNPSVAWVIDATSKLDASNPALQINKNEAQLFGTLRGQSSDKKALFVNFWSQVLAGRADRFLSGNAATDNYIVSGGDIQSLNEIKSLLHSDTKVLHQYQDLFLQTPVANSTKAIPVNLYYESFDVEGGAAVGTGAIYQVANGTSIQSADIEYFVNSGIYASLELEQLWPITVNGKTETLVWRADMVSTANVAYLRGTERLASGMIMLQDVKQAIDAFRTEFK